MTSPRPESAPNLGRMATMHSVADAHAFTGCEVVGDTLVLTLPESGLDLTSTGGQGFNSDYFTAYVEAVMQAAAPGGVPSEAVPNLVIDGRGLESIGSGFIGILAVVMNNLKSQNGALGLAIDPASPVIGVFEVCQFDQLAVIRADVEQVLAGIAERQAPAAGEAGPEDQPQA